MHKFFLSLINIKKNIRDIDSNGILDPDLLEPKLNPGVFYVSLICRDHFVDTYQFDMIIMVICGHCTYIGW